MIFAIATSYILLCEDPFMFFKNDAGLPEGILDKEFIYDSKDPDGKYLRISDGTVAFGAAKVSGLLERSLANNSWELYCGKTIYGVDVLNCIKTNDLNELISEFMFSDGTNRVIKTRPSRVTVGSLVDIAVGGLLNQCGSILNCSGNDELCTPSALWDRYSVDPPTFDDIRLEEVERIVTTDVVARTFCEFAQPTNLLGCKVLLGGCNGFYDTVIEGTTNYNLQTAHWYDEPPLVYADYGEILSSMCNTNDILRIRSSRFDYGRSQAESMLIALNDADVKRCDLNAVVTNYFVTFVVTGSVDSVNGSPNVRLSWDDLRRRYFISISDDVDVRRSVAVAEVVTNATPEFPVGYIYNTVEFEDLFLEIHESACLLLELGHRDILHLVPEGEVAHGFDAVPDQNHHGLFNVMSYIPGSASVYTPIGALTNFSFSVTSKAGGSAEYPGLPNDSLAVLDTTNRIQGIPEWVYEKGFVRSSIGYFLSSRRNIDENLEIDIESIRNSIHRYDTSHGDTFDRWIEEMASLTTKCEFMQREKTGTIPRLEIYDLPFKDAELKRRIEQTCSIDLGPHVPLDGEFKVENGTVYRDGIPMGDNETAKWYIPVVGGSVLSNIVAGVRNTVQGNIVNKTKVIYDFRNLRIAK